MFIKIKKLTMYLVYPRIFIGGKNVLTCNYLIKCLVLFFAQLYYFYFESINTSFCMMSMLYKTLSINTDMSFQI